MQLEKGPQTDSEGEVWFPWGIEQPLPRPGKPSGMNLTEMEPLKEHQSVIDNKFSQCPLGADAVKDTMVRGTVQLEKDTSLGCKHRKQCILP